MSTVLRKGVEEVRAELEAGELEMAARGEPALAGHSVTALIDLVRQPTSDTAEQDRIWLSALRCYQSRSPRLWAPVLLEMLAPAVIAEAYRLVRQFPEAEPADIVQQLLVSALTVARGAATGEDVRLVKLSLVRETRRRVRRWLVRSHRRQEVSLDALIERQGADFIAEPEPTSPLQDLLASGRLGEDAELVVRMDVIGERPHEVARRLGISRDAVESRLWRARLRLRHRLAA